MGTILYRPKNVKFVNSKADFPDAVAGVITLPADSNWIITNTIDLLGDRLVCAGIVAIHGISSETAFLKSTGLVGAALITTTYSFPLQNISITSATSDAISINGAGTAALDWTNVNFVDTPSVGTIKNVANFISSLTSYLSSSNLVIDGSVATISFRDTLFSAAGISGKSVKFAATAVISRRARFTDCSFVATTTNNAIEFTAGASVPTDQFIIRGCNFSGGATTYVAGILATDNDADFFINKGIDNSTNNGSLTMNSNAVATTVASANVYYKVAGTTVAGTLQRFTHSNNRLTYAGEVARTFAISASLSITSNLNNVINVVIRHYNSSNVLVDSSFVAATTMAGVVATGRAENVGLFANATLQIGDYIEVWVANTTSANDITVISMAVTCALS